MDIDRLQIKVTSTETWLAEAEQFERIAERLTGNADLRDGFKLLAADARRRAELRDLIE